MKKSNDENVSFVFVWFKEMLYKFNSLFRYLYITLINSSGIYKLFYQRLKHTIFFRLRQPIFAIFVAF